MLVAQMSEADFLFSSRSEIFVLLETSMGRLPFIELFESWQLLAREETGSKRSVLLWLG